MWDNVRATTTGKRHKLNDKCRTLLNIIPAACGSILPLSGHKRVCSPLSLPAYQHWPCSAQAQARGGERTAPPLQTALVRSGPRSWPERHRSRDEGHS